MNDGSFFGGGLKRIPLPDLATAPALRIPNRPLRKRMKGLPRFVVTRGGEYCFLPGLRALRWLANLET